MLIADDDNAIRTVLNQALSRAGYIPRTTCNASTLWRWVQQGHGDVVVTDVVMPDESGFELLPRITNVRPDLPVIVMSAQNTFMTALTAAERGAFEYLPKPFDLNELVSIVGRAMLEPPNTNSLPSNDTEVEELPLIGRSPAMQDIYRVLARLIQTDLTVMISGESGTGKELVARVLHDYSKRQNGPFIAVNMSAIPSEFSDSELFGHEKGAFPGAYTRYSGRFEQAEGGTLFLDEIGDMPIETQTRLLRVLQEGEYTTVGGLKLIKTNVRIIAATHRDLKSHIQQGLFREDLYYRLNVVPLRLPPLRQRLEDIGDLVHYFSKTAVRDGLDKHEFLPDAIERLKLHEWPGNVRELENLIRRISAIYPQEKITSAIIETELAETGKELCNLPEPTENLELADIIERYMSQYFSRFGDELPPSRLYDRIMKEVEVPLISSALTATRGNQIKAAELLGLNRNTLRSRIKTFNIQVVKMPSLK